MDDVAIDLPTSEMFAMTSTNRRSKTAARLLLTFVWSAALLAPLPLSAEDATQPAASDIDAKVDYARDIAPLFTRNCIACHNAKSWRGD
ncbi:MAG: hypothetical protein R3C56_23725 [Pirellulaceae bacterium]